MKKLIFVLLLVGATARGASPSFQQVTNVLQAPLVKTNDSRKVTFTNTDSQFGGSVSGDLSGRVQNALSNAFGQAYFSGTVTLSNSATQVAFILNLDTGQIQVRSNNVAKVTIDKTGTILASAGAAATPAFGWVDDADGSGTGFYRNAANRIGISINGGFIGQIYSSGYELSAPISTFTALTGNSTATLSGVSNAIFNGAVTSRTTMIATNGIGGPTNATPTAVTVGITLPDAWFSYIATNGTTYKIPAWIDH